MRSRYLFHICVIVCTLGVTRAAVAEPVEETSATYERLFSHDRKYQPRPERFLTLELDAQMAFSEDPQYRLFATFRLFWFVGIGGGVTGAMDTEPEFVFVVPFWLLDINDYGLYIPTGFMKDQKVFSGLGLSVPVGRHFNAKVELNLYSEGQNPWAVTVGMNFH